VNKIDEFSTVLDFLSNNEKDKLLISASKLIEAQKAVRITSTETSSFRKRKPAKRTTHKNHTTN